MTKSCNTKNFIADSYSSNATLRANKYKEKNKHSYISLWSDFSIVRMSTKFRRVTATAEFNILSPVRILQLDVHCQM